MSRQPPLQVACLISQVLPSLFSLLLAHTSIGPSNVGITHHSALCALPFSLYTIPLGFPLPSIPGLAPLVKSLSELWDPAFCWAPPGCIPRPLAMFDIKPHCCPPQSGPHVVFLTPSASPPFTEGPTQDTWDSPSLTPTVNNHHHSFLTLFSKDIWVLSIPLPCHCSRSDLILSYQDHDHSLLICLLI